jgi:hypothetical protein
MPYYAQKLFDKRRVSFDVLCQMYTKNKKLSFLKRYNLAIHIHLEKGSFWNMFLR